MIRFTRPFVTGQELAYLTEVLESPETSGNGTFARRCEALLEEELGGARVMMTPSCTHALELSALLLDVQPGDEVIVPTFTFTSTANAYVLYGAKPVFADIRPDTLNLDESALPELISERTRAVVPVHYAGVGCEMGAIRSACGPKVAVIEDNAHGLFGKKCGRLLGTLGDMAVLSFHDTKNFSAGEGGALVLNAPGLEERAEILREKGTNRTSFYRGEVDKYTWVDTGSSLLPSEFQMAVLLAQLEARDRIQSARRRIWERYHESLSDWAETRDCRTPHVPDGVEQSYHMFYLILPTAESQARFISYMRDAEIATPFHYVPLHLSEQGRRFGGKPGMCPVAESVAPRLVRLPLFASLETSDQDRVIETILSFQA
ncbi:MAG: dTDP-4-amino-4,6-dideoxygalactose transaminase [Gemmatimonadetes bacterium]|nr:dTDP-4-amino-4,6-dideoxygalactose transaminase [Gemmatimonadota bacterium]